MRKLMRLKKDYDVTFNSFIEEFLNPDYIYLPVKKNYQLLVKKGDLILKNQIIIENNLNKVISPISGKAVSIKAKNVNNQIVPCLVIENDFKEKSKTQTRKKMGKFDKDMIVSKLYEYYFKYIASILESKKINNLVISGIEDEPYIENNSFVLKEFTKEILEIADIISTHFEVPTTYIAMKSSDTKNVEKYLSKVGTYPNISLALVDDKYLLGTSFFLREHLGLKDLDTLVIDAKTMVEIYNALKYGRYITETFVTISGPMLDKSKVLKVKIGSNAEDVIRECVTLKEGAAIYVLNGLMTGQKCNLKDAVITGSTKGIVIIPDEILPESPCNLCGLCHKVCPVKVNPKKVMDTGKKSSNCIDCGLCSYICPSHINLRKFLVGDKDE